MARLGTYVVVQGALIMVEAALLGVKTTPMGAGEPIAIASLFLAEMAAHQRRTQATAPSAQTRAFFAGSG